MKKILIFIFIIFSFVLMPLFIEAVGILPRFKTGSTKTLQSTNTLGAIVSAHLSPDRKSLYVYFDKLQRAKSVIYTLTYQTEGKDEGVSGSIDLSLGNSATRELLFGTCSSGVCRYHTSITNMRLEVTSELSSGKRIIRRFRVRV